MSNMKGPVPPAEQRRLSTNSRLEAINKRYMSQSSVAFYGRESVNGTEKVWLSPPKAPGLLHPMPPMVRDPADSIQGRKFISASYAGPDLRIHDFRYSRRKYLQNMSKENSRRVVSFLRKRFRDRDSSWLENGEDADGDANGVLEDIFLTKSPEKFNVFSKYNEIGGRLSKEGSIYDGLYPGAYAKSPVKPKTPLAPLKVPLHITKKTTQLDQAKKVQELFQKIENDWENDSEDLSEDEKETSGGTDNAVPIATKTFDEDQPSKPSDELEIVSVADSELSKSSKAGSESGTKLIQDDERHTTDLGDDIEESVINTRLEKRDSLPLIESVTCSNDSKTDNLVSSPASVNNDLQLPLIEGDEEQILNTTDDNFQPSDSTKDEDKEDIKLPTLESVTDSLKEKEKAQITSTGAELPGIVSERCFLISPVLTPVPSNLDVDLESSVQEEKLDSAIVSDLLKGDLQAQCSVERKVICLYISSTFSDMESERTVLASKTFPKFLRPLCAEHGYELQVVDPHWGIKDLWTNDHSHVDICMRELNRCREISHGPFFVSMMGQKIGHQPLPKYLTPEEFTSIVDAIRSERDAFLAVRKAIADAKAAAEAEKQRKLSQKIEEASKNGTYAARRLSIQRVQGRRTSVYGDQPEQEKEDPEVTAAKATEKEFDDNMAAMETWYCLDYNQIPPMYTLQNVSIHFREFLSSDKIKRQRAKTQWGSVFKRLHKIFEKFFENAAESEEKYEDFLKPVSEKELEGAVLNSNKEMQNRVYAISRNIANLRKNLHDFTAKDYIDLHHQRSEVDYEVYEKIQRFRKEDMPAKLGAHNIQEFTVRWHKDGISAQSDRTHAQYLDSMNQSLSDALKVKFEHAVGQDGSKVGGSNSSVYEEVSQHAIFAQERCKTFYGRKYTLQHVKDYLQGSSNQPLILSGESGSGKSSIIAKSLELMSQWKKSDPCNIIYRFIGRTTHSGEDRYLLRSICLQICMIYNLDSSTVPEDVYGLINDFESRLATISEGPSLVIFLDGMDQLMGQNQTQTFNWLPSCLPRNIKVVMTTLESDDCTILKKLKNQCPDAKCVKVLPLTPKEISFLLKYQLSSTNRTLMEEQRAVVMALCEDNPTPLFLQLVCGEAAKWKSFSVKRDMFLPGDLRKMVNATFVQLENIHGEILVKRALGYITASHSGISYAEMQDLLSLDDAVMMDVINHNATRLWRFPSVLWSRLLYDMGGLVQEVKVDGSWVYRWTHSEFRKAAVDRYLNSKDRAPSYHTALADYFLGKWANHRKPYPGSESGTERFVDPQDIYIRLPRADGSSKYVYNLRKLRELPYHLHKSNQMPLLKSEVLFNYKWVLTKLKATAFNELLYDLQCALTVEPSDGEMRLMSDTLQLSMEALRSNPDQLASQLIGRLHRIILNDIPKQIGDVKKYPFLMDMLNQANNTQTPALIPSITCLAQPGGILYDLLAGHADVITAVCVTSNGLFAATASDDETIKLWDLRNRRVTKTIIKTGKQISKVLFLLDATYLAAVQESKILMYRTRDGALIHTINNYIDPPFIIRAGDHGQYLVAFFSGSNVVCSWDIENDAKVIFEREFVQSGIHKDASLCVAMQSNVDKALYAFRSDSVAYVINIADGRRILELKAPKDGASITALGISRDFYILVCRYIYMHLSEIHFLELFDIKTGEYIRGIKGCTRDTIKDLYINKTSSHALCLCSSSQNNSSEILVWNLDTDDHKHIAKHPKISTIGACSDLNFFLTATANEKSLRIWNISKNINERETGETSKRSAKQGIVEIVPMINNCRYVVAKTVNNGLVSVWNVVKGKCAGSAVRIERGLTEIYDIVLIRDDKIVILSDIGESTVSDSPTRVFQTVFVYCLKMKKYIRKLTGVFIVPSPVHEYHLLEGELLMGLSDTRDHLIVWCLVSGQIKYRIKRNHNKKELWRAPREDEEEIQTRLKRMGTAEMTPWDRRSETKDQRLQRKEQEAESERKKIEDRRQEKENAIAKYILSKDESIIICSYFAHHLAVFDVATQMHIHTLEAEDSMLYLYFSTLTPNGSHLVHTNYDNMDKTSYITIWNLRNGSLFKRLKNEPNVCCLGMNDDATRVLFGNQKNILKIWDVRRKNSTLRKLKAPSTSFKLSSESKIFMIGNGAKALVFAHDLTLWNLDDATLLATFTPDLKISCVDVVMEGELIVLALMDSSDVVTLRLKGRSLRSVKTAASRGSNGQEIFGETTGDSSEEESEDEAIEVDIS